MQFSQQFSVVIHQQTEIKQRSWHLFTINLKQSLVKTRTDANVTRSVPSKHM